MRTRFAQLSLPTKVLTIGCALTLLFAITPAIVWDNIELSFPSGLKEREEMRRSFQPPSPRPEVVRTARVNHSAPIGDPHEGASILLLWLAAASGALALTYLLAQSIVEPMKLQAGVAAKAFGQNFAIDARVCGQDETCRLGRMLRGEGVIHEERITGTGRLPASILHDLRNPVAAIYGAAEMLIDADLPPAQIKRLASNIYRASQRIQEMLKDQLNVSHGQSRGPEPSRLREIAEAACESLSATAESYGTTLAVDIAPVIELPLNRARMERALVNLISNAIEAMPEGGQVRISAQFVTGSVVVHVDDTGPGVAPQIRSKIFQPFVTAGKSNGLGLGLVFTRQTVLEHGGDLWLDVAPGGGARFSLRLPGAHVVQSQAVAV
jgi:signal transduction histidine kinase